MKLGWFHAALNGRHSGISPVVISVEYMPHDEFAIDQENIWQSLPISGDGVKIHTLRCTHWFDNAKWDRCPAGLDKICYENTNLLLSDELYHLAIDDWIKTNFEWHIAPVKYTMRCIYLLCDTKTTKIWSLGLDRTLSEDRALLYMPSLLILALCSEFSS